MPITCSCGTEAFGVTNEPCSAGLYGNQIVKVFLQKMTGTEFDGSLNNDITVEADWTTKLALTDDSKIIALPNLAGAVKESSEPNIEEGNDVPYDGADLIDKPQQISFDLKYVSDADFALIDQFSCPIKWRMWFLDNNDYLWGADIAVPATSGGSGVPNVSVVMTTLAHGGIGTKTKFAGNMVKWNSLETPKPTGQFSFLRTI